MPISESSIFSTLTKADQLKCQQIALPRLYQVGEYVVFAGDIWPYLILVEEGTLSAIKESIEGRSLIVETVLPGEIVWGMAFFDPQAQMPVSLSAEQDSRVLLWSREQLLPVLLNNGAALWELCQLLIWRVRRASDVLEELAFHPVAGRLAKFLVDQYGKSGEERIKRELTLDEMAAHIGSTREMVCRILQRFSTQGIIEITRTEFTFTNWEHLAQIAQTNVKEL